MIQIALLKEEKRPADNRVALTPSQCRWVQKKYPDVQIVVQASPERCYTDAEYERCSIPVVHNIADCDILVGIKEVPPLSLIDNKKYLFFSHTKKKQPLNQFLLQEIIRRKITLIDYECLEHDDGQRIIGFGFFAGIVGAHNGMMAYGNRTGSYQLARVFEHKTFRKLLHTYFGLNLPNCKIVVTGSGRVAQGALEIMNLMQIREVETEEFLQREFAYPVYVHLRGSDLYETTRDGSYQRGHFHQYPGEYSSKFLPYAMGADVLMNGVYWNENVPRLFELKDVADPRFRLQVIADITDDEGGSVPINFGDATMAQPVYGVDKTTLVRTEPCLTNSIDIMAVGNLPNELPRDASRYFGEQMIKYVLPDLLTAGSAILDRATIVAQGGLTPSFHYLDDYARGNASQL